LPPSSPLLNVRRAFPALLVLALICWTFVPAFAQEQHLEDSGHSPIVAQAEHAEQHGLTPDAPRFRLPGTQLVVTNSMIFTWVITIALSFSLDAQRVG
jgi:hypothetical protein